MPKKGRPCEGGTVTSRVRGVETESPQGLVEAHFPCHKKNTCVFLT